MNKKGVLLVNLGTPDSPSVKDVRRYLKEFLMDERVIDIHPLLRVCLVKGIIAPFRAAKSGVLYQKIWDDRTGSPLMHYSKQQQQLLQQELGDGYLVELAMRYQNPSIQQALNSFRDKGIDDIQVIALFPQYASATGGSVYHKIMDVLNAWPKMPDISIITSFYDNDTMIEAFADNGKRYLPEAYDHILFSFHSLPQRQLVKADDTSEYCTKVKDCCQRINNSNRHCYSAQSYQTARLIAQKLSIAEENYTVCFQSRLGNTPWIQPYTSEVIKKLAAEGKKRILVFCPAFVSDCLETLYEISVEYNELFKAEGGEHLQLVESLNDSAKWIQTLKAMVTRSPYIAILNN